jgi:hypothetical protein
MEIRRQLAEYDEKNNIEIDAMVLWVLYSEFGWGKKRLKRFWDCFADELKALTDRYVMDNCDTVWLCTRKLKDAGIDISQWLEESHENTNGLKED